mmetsp:Transcript_38373/g.48419  ORF Transcript_38373/g.48419 Transcript_38373/m.48419 type:complete len:502 (+) Transcript_38373:41-1546(+)
MKSQPEEKTEWPEESTSTLLGLGGELDDGFKDTSHAQAQSVGLLSQKKARPPVLRPPPTFRDGKYLGAFITHFVFILIIYMVAGARGPSSAMATHLPGLTTHWRPTLTALALATPLGVLGLAHCLVHTPMVRSVLVSQSLYTVVLVQVIFGVEIVAFCLDATPIAMVVLGIAALNMRHNNRFADQKKFGVVLMETVRAMVAEYPQVQVVFALGAGMYGLFALVWVQMFLALVMGAGSLLAALVWCLLMGLSLFWTAQTISRLMGVVITGTLVSYYFNLEASAEYSAGSGHGSGTWFNSPSLPWAFLRNGAGYSLGSVCKASLMAPLAQQATWDLSKINTKNYILHRAKEITAKLAKFSKSYHELSLVHVALYSKTFRRSAQDVWATVSCSGLQPVLKADFNRKILQWLAVGPGLGISIFLTTFQLHFRGLSWLLLTFACTLILILGFCISVQPLQAAMNCIYMQFAENPGVLSHCETSAMIYARIARITEYHQDSNCEEGQ